MYNVKVSYFMRETFPTILLCVWFACLDEKAVRFMKFAGKKLRFFNKSTAAAVVVDVEAL